MLIEFVVDPNTHERVRSDALKALRRVPRAHRQGEETIVRFMSVYTRLEDPEEKCNLVALVGASSPDALAFLAGVLDTEVDTGVRQLAASGLATWNIRRGVAELIRVLEECSQNVKINRNACNEAGKTFVWLNERKVWGFPESRIREEILSKTDVSNEEMAALFVSEINKWWVENERRFPDWKPGDPLPRP